MQAMKAVDFSTDLSLLIDNENSISDDSSSDDEVLTRAGRKRKGKQTARKKKTKLPLMPKPLKKKEPKTRAEAQPLRTRNESKEEDDELRRKYNQTTVCIGSIGDQLNPLLKETNFEEVMNAALINWPAESNYIRITVNTALRRIYSDASFNDYSISGIAH